MVDVKHVSRLTAAWAPKCDKTEAQPESSATLKERSCMCKSDNPSTAFLSFLAVLVDERIQAYSIFVIRDGKLKWLFAVPGQ